MMSMVNTSVKLHTFSFFNVFYVFNYKGYFLHLKKVQFELKVPFHLQTTSKEKCKVIEIIIALFVFPKHVFILSLSHNAKHFDLTSVWCPQKYVMLNYNFKVIFFQMTHQKLVVKFAQTYQTIKMYNKKYCTLHILAVGCLQTGGHIANYKQ